MEAVARWFFDALFGLAVNDCALIAVWTLPDKRTRFFDQTAQAADYAMSRAGDSDVYMGVCLYPPGIKRGRGRAADVVACPAMWADIDFGPHHKKPKLPPDLDAAHEILRGVGIGPSIVVNSGHGLHAYWPFVEAMSPADGAAELARQWSATVRAVARARGYDLDSVGDLSRVLRVPGTFNRKDRPIRVDVISGIGVAPARCEPDDLRSWCAEPQYDAANPMAVATVDMLVLRAEAEPPVGKFTALRENDRRFRRTFDHDRPDLTDQSPSAYDLALANTALAAGWTDQEVADLIGYFRCQHDLAPAKALRLNYVQRTIGTAKAHQQVGAAVGELERMGRPAHSAGDEPVEDADREKILALLSKILGVPIVRWVQDSREEAIYSLILRDGTDILIGPVTNVMNQVAFRGRLYETTGTASKNVKGHQWAQVQNYLGLIRELDENPETGRVNRLRNWVSAYTEHVTVYPSEDRTQAAGGGHPFTHEGELFLQANALARFVRYSLDEPVKKREVLMLLRSASFSPRVIFARGKSGNPTTRHYWTVLQNEIIQGGTEGVKAFRET